MKTLLATVAAAALVVGMSGAAWADEYHHDGNNNQQQQTSQTGTAVALAFGGSESEHNIAIVEEGTNQINTISSSFGGAAGAYNVGENSGANSVVNNTMSVASTINCGCSADNQANLAVAVAGSGAESERNFALVEGSQNNTITGSFGGAAGAFNISQNAGANSVVQGTMAIGSVSH